MKPENLRYARTHEWVHADGPVATVGISAFAVESLTDLVHMQLPEVGRKVKVGDSFGEIESVKAVSDLYSPVNGEVVEVNSALPDRLETLNEDPYGAGWVVKIRLDGDGGVQDLLDYAAYQQQCADETH